MVVKNADILILCKTYPSPSGKYTETSCVAGMDREGNLIRLFPVPFRLVAREQQFKKWQWIKAKIEKAPKDHRPESHVIKVDTIEGGDSISTKREWADRRLMIDKSKLFDDFDEMEADRNRTNRTLSLLKPLRVVGLDITSVPDPDWTEEELAKLEQEQAQAGLFDAADKPSIRTLRKLPFDFHYRYECGIGEKSRIYRHKISDWEAGALFWRCFDQHGDQWEQPFRLKMEEDLPSKDLIFLMGNIHRFQHQWLIISLIYPPHRKDNLQGSLF